MNLPVIAERSPEVLELAAGKDYYWCRCGRSNNPPFCDGSHEGTGFEPVKFQVEETKKYALCRCKHTDNKPFCDGSHKRL